MQKWLEYSDIWMYSTYNDGKLVASERFIRTSDLNTKLATLVTKAELNEKNKIVKHQVLDSVNFRGKSHFEDDGCRII